MKNEIFRLSIFKFVQFGVSSWGVGNYSGGASMVSKRKNIMQPVDWWAAFVRQSKAEGLTLSEWIGQCCRANLPTGECRTLTQRPPAHRPRSTAAGE